MSHNTFSPPSPLLGFPGRSKNPTPVTTTPHSRYTYYKTPTKNGKELVPPFSYISSIRESRRRASHGIASEEKKQAFERSPSVLSSSKRRFAPSLAVREGEMVFTTPSAVSGLAPSPRAVLTVGLRCPPRLEENKRPRRECCGISIPKIPRKSSRRI